MNDPHIAPDMALTSDNTPTRRARLLDTYEATGELVAWACSGAALAQVEFYMGRMGLLLMAALTDPSYRNDSGMTPPGNGGDYSI